MEEIQIGPWRLPENLQLLCLWIATVTEMSTGTSPSPSMMGRYLKKLPSLRECLVHCDSISPTELDHPLVTLWGLEISEPLVINTYRAFLNRIVLPCDTRDMVDGFYTRSAAILDELQENLISSLLPFMPGLPSPPRDWSNHCAFGPGAVAETPGQLSPYNKIRLLADLEDSNDDKDRTPTSRIILVPKNWKKKRLIAAEPIRKGFLQHGLAAVLMDAIEACSPIRFSDQGQNRCRCDVKHATIDLSDASDSVLLRHVSLILPEWYEELVSVRSSHAQYKNDPAVPLGMYGTMGSACTFPVETWVFYSLTYGIMNFLGATADELKDIRVYGDDIVVPCIWGQVVADFLVSVGFKVNASKSFWDTSVGYRETCGKETFYNSDVSPLRLPRGSTEMWLRRVDFQSVADFLTQLAYYGCFETQRAILSSIESWGARSFLKTSPRLGTRSTDENLPAFTVFAPTSVETTTNLSLGHWEKYNLVFSQDQWDVFARDFILSRRRKESFQGSVSNKIVPASADTVDVEVGCGQYGRLYSFRSEKLNVKKST